MQKYPESSEADRAQYWLGRCDFALADYKRALSDLEAVAAKYPWSSCLSDAQLWIGRCYHALSSPDALQAFQQVIIDDPDGASAPEAQYWIGRTSFEMKDYSTARTALNQQLARYPGNAFEDIVNITLARCDFEAASAMSPTTSAEATALFDQARTRLEATIASFPSSQNLDTATYWLGRALFELLDDAGARAQFEHLTQAWPQSKVADNTSYWIGRCSFAHDLWKEALTQFQSTDTNYPNSNIRDWVVLYIGRSQFELDDAIDAEITLRSQLDEWPESPTAPGAHYWLGRAEYAQGKLTEALAEFLTTAGGAPVSDWADEAFAYLVRTYADLDQCGDADTALEHYSKRFPSSPSLSASCAYRKRKCGGACP